ncbi:hypothetical protein P4O66_010164, partial [Electrophorus voltai]
PGPAMTHECALKGASYHSVTQEGHSMAGKDPWLSEETGDPIDPWRHGVNQANPEDSSTKGWVWKPWREGPSWDERGPLGGRRDQAMCFPFALWELRGYSRYTNYFHVQYLRNGKLALGILLLCSPTLTDYQNWYEYGQYPDIDSAGSFYLYEEYREGYKDYRMTGECSDVSLWSDSESNREEDLVMVVEEVFHRDPFSDSDTVDYESDKPPAPKAPPRACRSRASKLTFIVIRGRHSSP